MSKNTRKIYSAKELQIIYSAIDKLDLFGKFLTSQSSGFIVFEDGFGSELEKDFGQLFYKSIDTKKFKSLEVTKKGSSPELYKRKSYKERYTKGLNRLRFYVDGLLESLEGFQEEKDTDHYVYSKSLSNLGMLAFTLSGEQLKRYSELVGKDLDSLNQDLLDLPEMTSSELDLYSSNLLTQIKQKLIEQSQENKSSDSNCFYEIGNNDTGKRKYQQNHNKRRNEKNENKVEDPSDVLRSTSVAPNRNFCQQYCAKNSSSK